MVRLLVEEARHALPLTDDAQCERDDRPITSTSTAGASRAAGSFFGPEAAVISDAPSFRPLAYRWNAPYNHSFIHRPSNDSDRTNSVQALTRGEALWLDAYNITRPRLSN
jgi:hypothetical protein